MWITTGTFDVIRWIRGEWKASSDWRLNPGLLAWPIMSTLWQLSYNCQTTTRRLWGVEGWWLSILSDQSIGSTSQGPRVNFQWFPFVHLISSNILIDWLTICHKDLEFSPSGFPRSEMYAHVSDFFFLQVYCMTSWYDIWIAYSLIQFLQVISFYDWALEASSHTTRPCVILEMASFKWSV